MLGSMFPKYRISARMAETLATNEPDRWAAAESDLREMISIIMPSGSRRTVAKFTEDQIQRLVALAVFVELGVYKWSARAAEHTVQLLPESEPALATVGEPIDIVDVAAADAGF